MGEKIKYSILGMRTEDGTYIPVTEFNEIPEFESTVDPAEEYACVNPIHEIVGTLSIDRIYRKRIRRVIYGWKSRGPLRVKALNKAYKAMVRGVI